MPSARPCLSRRTLRILSATLAIGFSATFAEAQQNRDGAIDALRTHLDRLIRGPSWRDSRWGLLVMSLDHQDTLYAVDPERPLAPASNAKLLTTAAALHALGPDYRFLTYLLADAEVRDGVLDGDLTLYGTGDAGLSSRFYRDRDEVFEHLVDQLDEAGIREIRGDLVADAAEDKADEASVAQEDAEKAPPRRGWWQRRT